MNESKTCDNCNNRPTDCSSSDVTSDENGDCKSWQPIPVATTDTPEPEETTNPIRDLCNELIKAREAIAKRDDLIRRMADALAKTTEDECMFCGGYDDDHEPLCASRILISKANKLLGVK